MRRLAKSLRENRTRAEMQWTIEAMQAGIDVDEYLARMRATMLGEVLALHDAVADLLDAIGDVLHEHKA